MSGTGAINLIWDANTEADLGGYLVLRGEAPGDTLQPLTPQPIRETRYRDTAVKPGVRYVYAIVAVDRATPPNRSATIEPRGRDRQMKRFYRIEHNGAPRHVIEDGGRWRLLEGDLFGRHETGAEIAATGHRLLAPVTPSKVVCIGLNYKDHAAEQNKPLPE